MTGYVEVAAAAGAWVCPLRLPAVPVEQVRDALKTLAASGHPVAAMVHGDPVTELVLYRDPSRKHGTPTVAQSAAAAQQLAADTGWQVAPELAPRAGVLVGLGLREGYEEDAPVHDLSEVTAALGVGARCRVAQLVSMRSRWYEETGVAIEAEHAELPRIARVAAAMAQDRYVVTDLEHGRTVARKLTAAEPCEFEAGQRIAFTFSGNVYGVVEVVDHQVTYAAAYDHEDCTTSPCDELKPHVQILTNS